MEFFGTFVFAILYINQKQGVLLVGLWVLTTLLWKISASQMNPAITFAYMLRQDKHRIPILQGLLMMLFQILGAYLGAVYMAFTEWQVEALVPQNKKVIASIVQEIYGSFIFIIFFKIVSDERLYFSREPSINCLIIAASYIAARSIVDGATQDISTGGACLNPAFAIGIFLVSVFKDPTASLACFWI